MIEYRLMMQGKPGYKIHAQLIEQIQRDISKEEQRQAERGNDRFWQRHLEEQLTIVQGLKNEFPENSIDIKELDIKYKIRLLREELHRNFPEVKFTVRGEHYSGGCSIDVLYVDGPTTERVRAVADKYQYTHPDNDPQTDYFHVDNYCHTQRKITKWNERMREAIQEIKSKWHGPTDLERELKAQQALWAEDLPISEVTYFNASEN